MAIDFSHFEHILVYKLLTDEQFVATVKDYIPVKSIERKQYQDILPIIFNFYDTHNKLPNFSEIKNYLVTEDLKKSFAETIRVVKQFQGENFEEKELLKNTESYIKSKNVYVALENIISTLQSTKTISSDIVEQIQKAVSVDLSGDIGIEIFKDAKKIAAELSVSHEVISTGFRWLDAKLRGGFLAKGRAFYLFAGTVNVGKSIVLGNIAMNAAKQGKNVLLISLEMSEMMYATRLCSGVTGIPMSQLNQRPDELTDALEAIDSTNNFGKIFIKEFPPSTITPSHLQAYIKKLKSTGVKIDMIVIDYLNLLTIPGNYNSYERVKMLAEQVRAMSYVFACPIISASQLKRDAFNASEPGMEHMSESNGTSATADFIATIWKDEEDDELNRVRISVAKNRFERATGTMIANMNYNTLTMSEDIEATNETYDTEETMSILDKLGTPA